MQIFFSVNLMLLCNTYKDDKSESDKTANIGPLLWLLSLTA